MNRQIIRCGNYFGQKHMGVSTGAKNIFYGKKNTIISKVEQDIFKTTSNLYFCHNNLKKNKKRITIGGDHSISIASLAWTLNNYPKSKVIWIDAHADINTFESSKTKNYHGMPLSFLTGMDYDKRFRFIKNKLNLNNLLYVGIRDLDSFEKEIIRDNNVEVLNVDNFNKNNFDKIFEFIGDNYYHLSFDVDALDPKYMPCTGTPVNDGLDLESFKNFIDQLTVDKMINMDMVELNLSLGDNNDFDKSLKTIIEIEEALSKKKLF